MKQFSSIRNYTEHFSKLIDLERKEEQKRYLKEIQNISASEREERGRCHRGLHGKNFGRGLGGSYLIKFSSNKKLQESEIYQGKLVIATYKTPNGHEASGTVIERTNFSITVAYSNFWPPYALGHNVRVDLFTNDVTYKRMMQALGEVKRSQSLTSLLINPDYQQRVVDFGAINFQNSNLNDSQRNAVNKCLASERIHLIHGPPGTGKTTTLIEYIIQEAMRGKKILASADSNTAVDNMLEKLVQYNVNALRVGNVARMDSNLIGHSLSRKVEEHAEYVRAMEIYHAIQSLKEEQSSYTRPSNDKRRGMRNSQIIKWGQSNKGYRGVSNKTMYSMSEWIILQEEIDQLYKMARHYEKNAVEEVLQDCTVLCCTHSTAGSELLEGIDFNIAAVDEGSQATEPAALISMVKAEKWILSGDHKQLPPTVLSNEAQELSYSLFERLIDIYPEFSSMLSVQYRMNSTLMKFSNERFYNNQLVAHDSVENSGLAEIVDPSRLRFSEIIYQICDPAFPLTFVDVAFSEEKKFAGETSWHNQTEAEMTSQLSEALIMAGLSQEQIGIISPYSSQRRLIRELLNDTFPEIEVKTVDGFQGREKELMIISFVRSNSREEIGFLQDERRLNVAITRAKKKAILIGNAETLRSSTAFAHLIRSCHFIKV